MGTNLIAGHMRCVILVYSRLYLFLSSFLFLRHVLVNGSARKNLGILKPKVIEEKETCPSSQKVSCRATKNTTWSYTMGGFT